MICVAMQMVFAMNVPTHLVNEKKESVECSLAGDYFSYPVFYQMVYSSPYPITDTMTMFS